MLTQLLKRLTADDDQGFPGGVYPDQQKITAHAAIESCPLVDEYILPVRQHIGAPAELLVSVGDEVLRGQPIAQAQGYVSAPIHAPTSGRITAIAEHAIAHPSGLGMPCAFLQADGHDTPHPHCQPLDDWQAESPDVLRERVRASGIVGLGGAVFPTYVKLVRDRRFPVQLLILNGVECEPYLTNDHRQMLEYADEIIMGLSMVLRLQEAPKAIIAIEDNKADAAELMEQAIQKAELKHCVQVQLLPTRYPQGGEKQLIEALTGQQVPAGKLPIQTGVLCMNVGTCRSVYRAIAEGEPLIQRVVTVSGDAVPRPGNSLVRFGTPMPFVFAQHGLSDFNDLSVIHGGPMMGEVLASVHVPVVKSTTGLLAMTHAGMIEAHRAPDPCIRCGHCVEACPVSLIPNLLADYCRSDQLDKAKDYQLFDCIQCGCCSYVCPSRIPLVHYFRYAKGQVAKQQREATFAEASRQRNDARMQRIERDKAEREAKRARMKAQREQAAAAKAAKEQAAKAAAIDASQDEQGSVS